MNALSLRGRQMVFWGAILLFGWAIYELSIRFDEMLIWLSPVYSLVRDGKITWLDYLQRINWARLQTHLFLLVCALFALYALIARKNLIACVIALPIAVLLAIFSLGSTPLLSFSIWQKLKLIPLVLIALGSLLRLIGNAQRKKKKPVSANEQPARQQPYDPFRINRP